MNTQTNQNTGACAHTPGPWQPYVGNTRWCVETVAFPAKLTAVVYAGVDSPGCTNDAEQEANARLIAEAPALLEALAHAAAQFDFTVSSLAKGHTVSISSLQNCAAMARAAIAKATGGQS